MADAEIRLDDGNQRRDGDHRHAEREIQQPHAAQHRPHEHDRGERAARAAGAALDGDRQTRLGGIRVLGWDAIPAKVIDADDTTTEICSISENLIRLKLKTLDPKITYVVCCDTGRRSSAGAFILNERGFQTVVLKGGLNRSNL